MREPRQCIDFAENLGVLLYRPEPNLFDGVDAAVDPVSGFDDRAKSALSLCRSNKSQSGMDTGHFT